MPTKTVPARVSDRLTDAISRCGSFACIGLDPVLDKIPDEIRSLHTDPIASIEPFCRGVLHAAAGKVGIVKPQSACFERYGAPGVALLERLCHEARELGFITILDAKRGDIGVSAEHYAASALRLRADFITVNGYLGPSTIEPYLQAGLGVFVLVRTSNPDSDSVQGAKLEDGRTVGEMMADVAASLGRGCIGSAGYSDVGAVVGATKAADARSIRARMPGTYFLIPGYGAQGGTLDDIRVMLDERRGGVIVNASRSVLYPARAAGESWQSAIERAAGSFASELKGIG